MIALVFREHLERGEIGAGAVREPLVAATPAAGSKPRAPDDDEDDDDDEGKLAWGAAVDEACAAVDAGSPGAAATEVGEVSVGRGEIDGW